jgi:structure-specific endonuclease subunit SLX1
MEGLFLPAAINNLLSQAEDMVNGQFRFPLDVKADCKRLCLILMALQSMVEDAEKRSRNEVSVRERMYSLKAAVLEAEDLLSKFMYVALRKEIRTDTLLKRKERLFLPGWSPLKDRIIACFDGKKLKGVLKKIDAICAEFKSFGFSQTRQPVTSVFDLSMETISFVIESEVFGRNDDLEKIVGMITGEQALRGGLAVLPIVGMAGIGKTTLAQLVYNSEMIKCHFQFVLWVHVSYEFDVLNIAKHIIEQFRERNTYNDAEIIMHILRDLLHGRRYLLVLDDVWNESYEKWENLKVLIDCGQPGSVVIVTTQSQKVASSMGTMNAYNLQGLNENDLWDIFRKRAFRTGLGEPPEFVEIGKQLLKKHCSGMPLVAKMLGGLLSLRTDVLDWLHVLDSNTIWDYDQDFMFGLKRSFDTLPSHVKRCFAFCAVYPQDFVMERDTLIQLWMANNYIPSESNNIKMEAAGMEIFHELASIGFFQVVKKEKVEGLLELASKTECKLPGLVHGLAQSLVGNECHSLLNFDQQSDSLPNETLHVSFSNTVAMLSLFRDHSSRSLRTILSLSKTESAVHVRFSKANSLRAISLRNAPIEEIHVEPGTLKHLRYLDLSYCIWLKVLPECLCTAILQTLNLSGCSHLELLPDGMRYMRSLRHVYLDGCDALKRMPAGLGKLSCLQTLTRYIIDPSIGCSIEELKDLDLGGLLALYYVEKVGGQLEAKLGNLISKKNLIQLELLWADNFLLNPDAASDTLEGLIPSQELQVLKICHYSGVQFSGWMGDSVRLGNLTKLMLNDCRKCTTLPPLWLLPSLRKLNLWFLESLKYICCESDMLDLGDAPASREFPKLEFLHMAGMSSLECWQENDEAGQTSLACPQLRWLVIKNCPKLDALPSCPLLSYLEITERSKIPSSLIESKKNNGVDIYI